MFTPRCCSCIASPPIRRPAALICISTRPTSSAEPPAMAEMFVSALIESLSGLPASTPACISMDAVPAASASETLVPVTRSLRSSMVAPACSADRPMLRNIMSARSKLFRRSKPPESAWVAPDTPRNAPPASAAFFANLPSDETNPPPERAAPSMSSPRPRIFPRAVSASLPARRSAAATSCWVALWVRDFAATLSVADASSARFLATFPVSEATRLSAFAA